MEFDYTNLRVFIKENFHNLKEFAQFIGIGTTQLGQRLANKVSFTQREIDRVANNMECGKLDMNKIYALFFQKK